MKKGSLEQQNECTPRITCFILLSLFLTLSRMCSCSFNFLRRCGTGCHESNPTANLRKPFVEYHCSITHFYHARFTALAILARSAILEILWFLVFVSLCRDRGGHEILRTFFINTLPPPRPPQPIPEHKTK